MRDLSRRDLLRATAVGAGAVAIPSMISGSSAIAADGPGWPSDTKFPPTQLTGRIVRPQSPNYAEASLGWDELFVHYPLVIVFAQETQDVVNALTWARQHDVALRVRSGRHNLEGWSNVDNGIVIDVSELKDVHIDTAARVAKVGAGLTQSEAVTALGEHDLAATTGTEGTVGLSGATLGGGFGFLTRYIGMACDNLIGAEIVVAAGADGAKVLEVDPWNYPDLLWALRGAGNGNFGIVTSLTYKVAPLTSVAYLQVTWPGLDDLHEVFDAWQRVGPFTDPRLGTQVEVHPDEILLFAVLAEGSEAEARKLLAPILSIGNPTVTVQIGGWGDVYAGFQIPNEEEPAKWKFFSQFTREPFPEKAVSIVREFMEKSPSPDSNFFTQAFGRGRNGRSRSVARPSRTATRSSTPSPASAGAPAANPTATTPSPRSPRPGSPSSARRCGPTWTAPTSTCRTSAWPSGRRPTGGTTSPGCARSRRSTTRTTSSSTSRASRPRRTDPG